MTEIREEPYILKKVPFAAAGSAPRFCVAELLPLRTLALGKSERVNQAVLSVDELSDFQVERNTEDQIEREGDSERGRHIVARVGFW